MQAETDVIFEVPRRPDLTFDMDPNNVGSKIINNVFIKTRFVMIVVIVSSFYFNLSSNQPSALFAPCSISSYLVKLNNEHFPFQQIRNVKNQLSPE